MVSALVFTGCEREPERKNPYAPNGPFQSRLDARGKRIVVNDHEGKTVAKLRLRDGEIKVYDEEMASVGRVTYSTEPDLQITMEERSGDAAISFKQLEPAVWVLGRRLRLEKVSDGWAILGENAERLGYVSRSEDGKVALRDDYSSAPRVFVRSGDPTVKSPTGADVLTTVPPTDAVLVLPFALEGTDVMSKVALGVWLQHLPTKEQAAANPADTLDAAPPRTSDAGLTKNAEHD